MSGFETKAPKESKPKVALPAELPDAAAMAKTPEGTNGAVYKLDSGQRFRLRHASTVVKPARWIAIVARKPKADSKPTAAAGKK